MPRTEVCFECQHPTDHYGWCVVGAAEKAVAAERERITREVGKLFDSPAAYPGSMAQTIRAENDLVRAVLSIVNPEAER